RDDAALLRQGLGRDRPARGRPREPDAKGRSGDRRPGTEADVLTASARLARSSDRRFGLCSRNRSCSLAVEGSRFHAADRLSLSHPMKLILSGVALSALAFSLPAQVGTYDLYGNGCAGNGGYCFGVNPMGASYSGTSLPNEYAYPATAPSAMTVVGFNLYCQSNLSSPATVLAALYLEDPANPGAPSTTPAAVGTLTAGTAVAFYPAMLDQPVTLQQGANFWLGAESINVRASATSGNPAPGTIYWRRPPQGVNSWTSTVIVQNPAYQVVCTTGTGGGA